MFDILAITTPVFLVIGFGYLAVWKFGFSENAVEALVQYTLKFAIPMLLFRGMLSLDLSAAFDTDLLLSFYTGALASFLIAGLGARFLFQRSAEDSVAIGFVGLFSNTLLIGLPITERALGAPAMPSALTIISVHSLFCYLLGISTMEIVRSAGKLSAQVPVRILKSIFSNALILGIAAGILCNIAGITLPVVIIDGVDLIARSALPTALFSLGGVIFFYKPEGDMRVVFFVVCVSLIIHPTIVFTLGNALNLQPEALGAGVIISSMPPGVNVYVFASIYGTAKRVAATSVLAGTAASVVTSSLWIAALGG